MTASPEKKSTESSGLGLKYVRARLEEAYGRKWKLDSRPVDRGWAVTISIEKETNPMLPSNDRLSVTLAGAGSPG